MIRHDPSRIRHSDSVGGNSYATSLVMQSSQLCNVTVMQSWGYTIVTVRQTMVGLLDEL